MAPREVSEARSQHGELRAGERLRLLDALAAAGAKDRIDDDDAQVSRPPEWVCRRDRFTQESVDANIALDWEAAQLALDSDSFELDGELAH